MGVILVLYPVPAPINQDTGFHRRPKHERGEKLEILYVEPIHLAVDDRHNVDRMRVAVRLEQVLALHGPRDDLARRRPSLRIKGFLLRLRARPLDDRKIHQAVPEGLLSAQHEIRVHAGQLVLAVGAEGEDHPKFSFM